MRLKEFLFAPKSIVDKGAWSDKKMPKTGGKFPLSSSRSYRLGGRWRWRVVELKVGIREFRLLIAYRQSKQQYLAILGDFSGKDTLILASYEYHSTHAGWHVHGSCAEPDDSQLGKMRHAGMRRFPRGNKRHRKLSYGVDDSSAITIAAKFYKIQGLGPDPVPPQTLNLFP
jgi:hypothetical protein